MSVTWNANFPTLTLEIMFNGSTYTDVTSYVRECYTNRPPSRETGRYPAGTMTVTLDNRDGRFSPFNLSGPYVSAGVTQVLPDVQVRLSATWSATTYYLFCGYTEDWQDEFPDLGTDAVTVLTCVDPLALLASIDREPSASQGGGENSSARIQRIINALPVPPVGVDYGDTAVQATTLEGNALEECYRVADSEGGAFLFDPSAILGSFGAYIFTARSSLLTQSRSNTSQVTFGTGGLGFRDLVTTAGKDQVVRSASYANVGGTVQTAGSGAPSRRRSDLIGMTDADALAVAGLAVAIGDPTKAPRVTSVTIDPVTSPSAMWPHALGRRIRDRATVTVTIPVSGQTISRSVYIDGVSHSITPLQWSTTFQFGSTSAWDQYSPVGTWDSAVWDTSKWFF